MGVAVTDSNHIRDEALELYALGGLPDDEAAALKSHLAACGECAMKLARSCGTAALLSFAAKQEKPAGTIKAELMARIRANRENEEDYAWPVPAKDRTPGKPSESTSATDIPNAPWWTWVLVPAAVALALVSLGLSWQNRRMSQALEKQRQATQALIQDRKDTEQLIALLAAADTVTIKLTASADLVGTCVVQYNSRLHMLAYSAQLPPAPAGKTYQLWLVPSTGTPINAGLLEKGSHTLGFASLPNVPADAIAKSFAVTIEPAGGAPQPTGPKVLVGAI